MIWLLLAIVGVGAVATALMWRIIHDTDEEGDPPPRDLKQLSRSENKVVQLRQRREKR